MHLMLIAFSVSARLADNNHYRTPRARARSRLSLLSTPPLPQPRRVNRLVRTLPQQPGTRGLTTPFPFPALLSTSARFVFALSMLFFVLMFRFLHRTWNTHSAKRPVWQRPLSSRQCVFIGVLPVFYVSLGKCRSLVNAAEKVFGMLSVSPNPNQLGPKAHPKPDFISSEACVHDDDIPTTHIAVAVEGVIWSSQLLSHAHCIAHVLASLGHHRKSQPSTHSPQQ